MKCGPDGFWYLAVPLSLLGPILPSWKKNKRNKRKKGSPELMVIGENTKFIYTCFLWKRKQK